MKAYSQDLRERVLHAVDQGYPRAQIVKMLGVSLATIKRYLKQRRELGHVQAKAIPGRGRTPKKLVALQAGVVEHLQAYLDVTLEQHCDRWEQAHGVPVSRWTMSQAIQRVDWTRKKSRLSPANAMRRNESAGASR